VAGVVLLAGTQMLVSQSCGEEAAFLLWGKGSKDGSCVRIHPLVCHLCDSAAVAGQMWKRGISSGTRSWVSSCLGLDAESTFRWLVFLTGTHDVGKASPAFQSGIQGAAPGFVQRLTDSGFRFPPGPVNYRLDHGAVSALALEEYLQQRYRCNRKVACSLAAVVGGHHGIIPSRFDIKRLRDSAVGKGLWRAARSLLLDTVGRHTGLPDSVPTTVPPPVGLWIAGFVSVCDWIASNERYFPLAATASSPAIDAESYWGLAQTRAAEALSALGWLSVPHPDAPMTFRDLFPELAPRPVQEVVSELAAGLVKPGLVIVEAPTGEGKTEAAFFLMQRWLHTLDQRGAYLALPTQATSNQMFRRIGGFLCRGDSANIINLQLLHGHASLSAEFQQLRENADRLYFGLPPGESIGTGFPEKLVAAEWFTHRKRGLLGPYGVGTVDQLLLCGLQARHVFVRLFGVAGKTVIVDEVHAYDTYMTTLLERVLEWLASLGTSVVLLSATLPRGRHDALLSAYARGAGVRDLAERVVKRYPRISAYFAGQSEVISRSVGVSKRSQRTIHIEMVSVIQGEGWNHEAVRDLLLKGLEDGGCAAVVCNTVREAQSLYCFLKPYFPAKASDGGPELDLLHSRFLYGDREVREECCLARFGKKGEERPHRAVLVATQIIEQSLDLDFDYMVSDLAPVDLIVQRAGRLHRHDRRRPAPLSRPVLAVWMPPVNEEGLPVFPAAWTYVYALHTLLRSWLVLRNRTAIRIPDDVDELIEAVYDDRPCPSDLRAAVAALWHQSAEELSRSRDSERSQAYQRVIKPVGFSGPLSEMTRAGLEEDSPEMHQAFQALTRLAQPSADLVLLEGPLPASKAPPSVAEARDYLRRSVRVSDRRIIERLAELPVPESWKRSPLLRRHHPIILNNGQCDFGDILLVYSSETGLTIKESIKGNAACPAST